MIVDKIALILVIVGALNWGGVGLFGFDTVAFLFGGQAAVLHANTGFHRLNSNVCQKRPRRPLPSMNGCINSNS